MPVVAGYGAHRLPYYTAGTNIDAIRFGARILEKVLGAARPVYYPDQRLTTCKDNVAGALRAAAMEYVVVDAGTGQGAVPDGADEAGGNTAIAHAKPPMGAWHDGRWMNWQYVWRDRRSGTKVLFIDKEMKDALSPPTATPRTRDPHRPSAASSWSWRAHRWSTGNVVVYSDDADKASGNGWFDGQYGDPRTTPGRRTTSATRPCCRGWPPVGRGRDHDDLTDADVVGELDLLRASDPYIEEQWRLPNPPADGHDNGLAYDTWYAAWAGTTAAWLGETLRAVSDRAEQALDRARAAATANLADPDDADELLLLARLYFLMCLHESQWSKRPRIEPGHDGFDHCENFVAAESLQLRNAHVYLAARHWARWARDGGTGRTGTTGQWWWRSRRRASLARHPRGGGPSRRGCTGTTTRWPMSCSTTSTRSWSSTATAAGSRRCSRWSGTGRSR